jgi:hypothetical protein
MQQRTAPFGAQVACNFDVHLCIKLREAALGPWADAYLLLELSVAALSAVIYRHKGMSSEVSLRMFYTRTICAILHEKI